MPETAQWHTLKSAFAEALDLPADQRAQYLDRVCGGDAQLRAEIEELLASYREGQDLFQELSSDLGSPVATGPCFEPGEWVAGRFRIIRHLSSGGMADVFEADDTEINDRVALKTLRAGRLSEGAIRRFRQEVRLARSIKSDYVCTVYEVARHKRDGASDLLLLCMELIRGGTLASEVRLRGRIPEQETLTWTTQIVQGLQAAHRLNILHCDIKSSNVMLAPVPGNLPRAVITDFGLARAIQAEDEQPHLIAGTPVFMSPEQLAGCEPSVTTDIYSLGVVIYELLTGTLPFNDTGSLEELIEEKSRIRPIPSAIIPVSKRWDVVVGKCLHPDPKERFHSVAEIAAALGTRELPHSGLRLTRRVWVVGAGFGAAAGAIVWQSGPWVGTGSLTNSIVVIPFEAGDPGLEYLSEGLTEQLSDTLSKVPGVRVIARTSAARFKGQADRLDEIRKELRVQSVLTGSVRKNGNGLRVRAELIDTDGGVQRWAESYDVQAGDLRMVKETISRAAIQKLHWNIDRAQIGAIESRTSRNSEAYNFYLLGRYYAAKRTPSDVHESIGYFEKAIAFDPAYASAHSALGMSYHLAINRGIVAREVALPRSEESSARALQLDPGLSEPHLVIGSNDQHYRWNWKAAEQRFRHVVATDPGYSVGHHWLAGLLSMLSKHGEAIAEIEIARDLDPLSLIIGTAYGAFLHRARRHEEAVQQLRWVLTRDASFRNAYLNLSDAYVHTGRLQEAIEVAGEGVKLTNRAVHLIGQLGYCLALAGRAAEALQLVEEVKADYRNTRTSACSVARVYIGLRDFEQAFLWLNQAMALMDMNLTVLKVDPQYDVLRGDRRYQELLNKLQL